MASPSPQTSAVTAIAAGTSVPMGVLLCAALVFFVVRSQRYKKQARALSQFVPAGKSCVEKAGQALHEKAGQSLNELSAQMASGLDMSTRHEIGTGQSTVELRG